MEEMEEKNDDINFRIRELECIIADLEKEISLLTNDLEKEEEELKKLLSKTWVYRQLSKDLSTKWLIIFEDGISADFEIDISLLKPNLKFISMQRHYIFVEFSKPVNYFLVKKAFPKGCLRKVYCSRKEICDYIKHSS